MVAAAEASLAAIQSMQAMLQIAGALLRSGRRVDLGGLDAEAARICAAIGLLPEAEAAPLRPALEALLRELDRVTAALPLPSPPPD
jgi:hypothetical protein